MTLYEIKKAVVALDPYDIVKCGLDCFAPYAYFDLPASVGDHVEKLTEDEQEEFSEFLDEYLHALQGYGTIIDFDNIQP